MGMPGASTRQILLATIDMARTNMHNRGPHAMKHMNNSTVTLNDMHGPLGQEHHRKLIRMQHVHANRNAPDGLAQTPNTDET